MLIGICGHAGAGKDTLADMLVERYGFVKYSLATPIKELLNARFGWSMADWDSRAWKEESSEQCGYHAASYRGEEFSPRSWAQWLGTEVGRHLAGNDVWVNLMAHRYGDGSVPMVVPDIRFDNEARTVENLGGVVIKLSRPGTAPVRAHVSELGVSPAYVSHTFINHGTREELFGVVERALKLRE